MKELKPFSKLNRVVSPTSPVTPYKPPQPIDDRDSIEENRQHERI
jgi:hypothetical protein